MLHFFEKCKKVKFKEKKNSQTQSAWVCLFRKYLAISSEFWLQATQNSKKIQWEFVISLKKKKFFLLIKNYENFRLVKKMFERCVTHHLFIKINFIIGETMKFFSFFPFLLTLKLVETKDFFFSWWKMIQQFLIGILWINIKFNTFYCIFSLSMKLMEICGHLLNDFLLKVFSWWFMGCWFDWWKIIK